MDLFQAFPFETTAVVIFAAFRFARSTQSKALTLRLDLGFSYGILVMNIFDQIGPGWNVS